MKKSKWSSFLAVVLCITLLLPVTAYAGVWHNPYGMDDLYEIEPTERYPRNPAEGDTVYIKCTTWPVEWGQSVWINYTVNGVAQQDVGASWQYNDGNNSYWQIEFGPFNRGDHVEYTVHTDTNGQNESNVGPYSFDVAGWDSIQSVSLLSQSDGRVVFDVSSGSGVAAPKLVLSFPSPDTLRFFLAPFGEYAGVSGISAYQVSEDDSSVVINTDRLRVTVTKNPYSLNVYDIVAGKELLDNASVTGRASWLTDGNTVSGTKEGFSSPGTEKFYGFGEHYNTLVQRGNVVDTYVYNQYQNQGNRTYFSAPVFYSSRGYGLYLNSTCYSQFDMASSDSGKYSFRAETDNSADAALDYYLFAGTPTEVLDSYTGISGRPEDLPKWAFGLWMSANEWDRQSEVETAVSNSLNNDIPATAVVLEQWSDENTFYIFNDSTYTAKNGGDAFSYNDFSFSEKWYNPRAMADNIHNNGMKLVLWQVPVLKYTDYAWEQKDNDENYMISQGYAVGDGNGGWYRTPAGTWFGNSLLLDFTNEDAVDWWMSKRAYLFDGVGIDGFKTDGGEMVWGHDLTFFDGSNGSEMRNKYPNTYIKAYNDFSREKTGTGITFSRAGTSGAQSYGAFWAGDQSSTFSTLRDSVRAGLSAGLSGVPFWSWDLAGFTGNFPNSELYKRSTMMAAFAPIMQFHSEKSNPAISEERSPWNVQARTGDTSVIPHFRYYVNTRMNLLPYIYSESKKSSSEGAPLMRAMIVDYPEDTNVYSLDSQYMFGRNLLVAPVVDEGAVTKNVYFPQGEWIDFFDNTVRQGGESVELSCTVDQIPVYVKSGSIIPLNLNDDYSIGGSIGNDLDSYTNLTFRVYPDGVSAYTLYNNDDTTLSVTSNANFSGREVEVGVGARNIPVTVQVLGTSPSGVSVNGTDYTAYTDLDAFRSAGAGYYYSAGERLTYVKVPASQEGSVITLSGIDKMSAGQENPTDGLGNVISAQTDDNTLVLLVDNGRAEADDKLTVQVCDDNILRVDYQPCSHPVSADTPIIDPDLNWDPVNASIDTSGDPIIVTTSDMRIEIAKYPCRMTVKKADGTTLFWEPYSGGVFDDGVRFVRSESTNMYGIHSYDCFTDNGELLRNNNVNSASAGQQGNSGGPFMWSTAGYGLLVDSDGGYPYTNAENNKMEFYYGDNITEGRRFEKEDVEYFIILGDPKDILGGYSKITGTSPMMPKWSMGFMNFEWDIDESELNRVVDTYRAKSIPIDAYAFDYDWKQYGSDNYGEFTWNTSQFPSASTDALKNNMLSKGIKMIGITKPRIVTKLQNGTQTRQGSYAEANGLYYPGHYEYTDYFLPVTVRGIDFYDPDAREWWWDHSQTAFDKGIVGWWNDETDKVSSNGADYWFGNFETLGISQAVYEGQREYTNDGVRVWQTARNYYPGTQRYGTSLWSGDVATQFRKGERVDWAVGLDEQKVSLLSTINNGQFKWGTDGGGFNQNSGNIENPSPELYTRWLQLASVVPVFRVHGTNHQQRQPWCFGSTAEEAVKSAILKRYEMLPYLYSYEYKAYKEGIGLVRPLLFEYPDDEAVANYSDAWMLGDWILVAPVTEKGQCNKLIYLPEGEWTDLDRGTVYSGGGYISYGLNAETWTDIPMFAKAGAIIATQESQNYIGEKEINCVKLDIFPSPELTGFDCYDDDGSSYAYENGAYSLQKITAVKNSGTTVVGIGAKQGTYASETDYYMVAVHGQCAQSVNSLQHYNDYEALKNAAGEGWCSGRDIYGKVTYIKINAGSGTEKQINVTGDAETDAESYTYEAEYASLSGSEVSSKAGVNNNHSGYSGAGFVDKLESDEAAVTFYAKVSNKGCYNVSIGYANGYSEAKSLSIYVNGIFEKKLNAPGTGGWNDWDETDVLLDLEAGTNSIMLKYDADAGDTGHLNIDYIEIPFVSESIEVEAESANGLGGASVGRDHNYYSGTGFVDGITGVGAAVEFTADMSYSGAYSMKIRYANGTGNSKTMNLYVNGSFERTLTFAGLGNDWDAWATLTANITLTEGKNTIKLQYDSGNGGNINIDRITVLRNYIPYTEVPIDNSGFENSSGGVWTEWHPAGQACAYGIDSGSGSNPPESPAEGDKRAFFYLAGPYRQSIHQGIDLDNGDYRVYAWVRVANTDPATARMELANHGGDAVYIDMPDPGEGWKLIYGDVHVTTGYLDIGFYCDSAGGTTVHIDGVKIFKK